MLQQAVLETTTWRAATCTAGDGRAPDVGIEQLAPSGAGTVDTKVATGYRRCWKTDAPPGVGMLQLTPQGAGTIDMERWNRQSPMLHDGDEG